MTTTADTTYLPGGTPGTLQTSQMFGGDGQWEVTLTTVSGGLWVATAQVTIEVSGSDVDSSHIGQFTTQHTQAYWLPQGATQKFKVGGDANIWLASDQPSGDETVFSYWATEITA